MLAELTSTDFTTDLEGLAMGFGEAKSPRESPEANDGVELLRAFLRVLAEDSSLMPGLKPKIERWASRERQIEVGRNLGLVSHPAILFR